MKGKHAAPKLSLPKASESESTPHDPINHPKHYQSQTLAGKSIEAIEVIESFKLGFNLGNVIKYICRADAKGASLEDLKKARWYINYEIRARMLKPNAEAGSS